MTKRFAFRRLPAEAPKIYRAARLLALAHRYQKILDSGEVKSMAELARLGRVSRARITQIMDLLMLAPEIQEAVLCGDTAATLREVLPIAGRAAWSEQQSRWCALGYRTNNRTAA